MEITDHLTSYLAILRDTGSGLGQMVHRMCKRPLSHG